MAKYGYGGTGVYNFPNVDFGWLADLPSTARETGKEFARREALAGLQSSDPGSLDQAAARLLAAGDIEGAGKLYQLSTGRRSQQTAGAAAQAQLEYLKTVPGALNAANKAVDEGYTPNFSAPAPAGAPPWPGEPGGVKPGPGAALAAPGQQMAQVRPPPPPPGPTLEGESLGGVVGGGIRGDIQLPPQLPPGATRIGEAPEALPASTQVAGPPMVQSPNVPPPAPPPAGFDPRFSQFPEVPAAPAPARPALNVGAEQDQARRELRALEGVIAAAPKGAVNPILLARYRAALERANIKGERGDYAYSQAQNRLLGEPEQTFTEWKQEDKLVEPRFKEFQKAYEEVRTEGKTAEDIQKTVSTLRSISKNKDFVSGESVAIRNRFVSGLGAAVNYARALGVDEKYIPDIEGILSSGDTNIIKSVQLTAAFDGLSAQLVIKSLGGLGRQISDQDRKYQEKAFANLKMTPETIDLLLEYHDAVAEQSKSAFRAAEAYRGGKPASRADVVGLDRAVRKYAEEHPLLVNKDGSKTALGAKIDVQLEKQKGVTGETGTGLPRPYGAPRAQEGRDLPAPPPANLQSLSPADIEKNLIQDSQGNLFVNTPSGPVPYKE